MLDQSSVLGKEVDVIRKRVELLDSLDENALKNQVDLLISAVPPTKSLASIITGLELLSSQTQISMTDFSIPAAGSIATESAIPVAVDASLGSFMIPINVTLEGTMDQTKNFLNTLIRVRRLMSVGSITVTFDKTPEGNLKTVLKVNAFYALLPKTLGNPAQPLTPLTASEEEVLAKIGSYQELSPSNVQLPVQFGSKPDPFSP